MEIPENIVKINSKIPNTHQTSNRRILEQEEDHGVGETKRQGYLDIKHNQLMDYNASGTPSYVSKVGNGLNIEDHSSKNDVSSKSSDAPLDNS